MLALPFAYLKQDEESKAVRHKRKEEEMGGKGKQKVSLEQYISFHENPHRTDLTNNCLNQIISMHGFIKLHRYPKKDVIEALNSIEAMLMPPRRSTRKEKISSSAFLSLEQVKEDLEVLEWSECPLQSIRTLKSAEENLLAADDLQIICASSTSDPCRFLPSPATVESRGSAKRSRSNKMRETAMKTGADAGDSDSLLLPSSWQAIGLC